VGRGQTPERRHLPDFEVAKLARFAAQRIALAPVKAERFCICIPDDGVVREPPVYGKSVLLGDLERLFPVRAQILAELQVLKHSVEREVHFRSLPGETFR
jgi:hypothetical protein